MEAVFAAQLTNIYPLLRLKIEIGVALNKNLGYDVTNISDILDAICQRKFGFEYLKTLSHTQATVVATANLV